MQEIEPLNSVSLKIKNTRKTIGISQKRLAKFIGISQSTVARLESDIVRMNPSYRLVYNVFDALDELGRGSESAEVLVRKAYELMHKKIVYARKGDSLKRAIEIMKSNDFSQLPVLNSNMTVAGTVHQKRLLDVATQSPNALERMKVCDVLDPSLPQVDRNTPVSRLKPILQSWDAVLVVDGSRAVGIITIYDLFRIL